MDPPSQGTPAIPGSTIRCELITSFCRLEELSAEWERLWRADPSAEMFQSFAWVRAWWRCYGGQVALCSLAVFEGERTIGIVPLVKDGDRIVFLGGKHADYCDILCEEDRAAEVFEAALKNLLQLPGWKEGVLPNLKVGGRIVGLLAALPRELRRQLQIVPCDDCHTIRLGENRDVLVSLLGKDHTKRRLKKLRKAGSVTFRHLTTKTEAQAQLSEFFRHQTRRRALAGKASTPPEFYRFLRNLIDELDLTKELRFGALALNDRPLAWHLSFLVNGKLLFYQQTFDVDVWDYSPGEVLIHELLLYAQKNVTREFDFSRGNEPFKDRFTTHLQQSCSLYIEPTGVLGQSRRLFRVCQIPWISLGRYAQRLAKRHDQTFHGVRSVRLWTRGVLARMRYHHQKKTLISYTVNSVVRLFRSIRLSKVDVDLFPPNGHATGFPVVSDPGLRVSKGGLGDLVDLALEHPEVVVPFELPKYRRRLKNGDEVYLVWREEKVVLVGWTASRSREGILPSNEGGEISAASRLLLLYECWPVSNTLGRIHYRQLLWSIAQEAAKKKVQFGVCCPDMAPSLRSELTGQPV